MLENPLCIKKCQQMSAVPLVRIARNRGWWFAVWSWPTWMCYNWEVTIVRIPTRCLISPITMLSYHLLTVAAHTSKTSLRWARNALSVWTKSGVHQDWSRLRWAAKCWGERLARHCESISAEWYPQLVNLGWNYKVTTSFGRYNYNNHVL